MESARRYSGANRAKHQIVSNLIQQSLNREPCPAGSFQMQRISGMLFVFEADRMQPAVKHYHAGLDGPGWMGRKISDIT